MRYRALPVEIDAIQWLGDNEEAIRRFGAQIRFEDLTRREATSLAGKIERLQITVLQVWDYLQETWVTVNWFDFIIRGTEGEFYPCAMSVFLSKYMLVEQAHMPV